MVKRYGDDAMLETAARADQLLDDGDMAGAWRYSNGICGSSQRVTGRLFDE
jgi:hypothetical protein